MKGVHNRLSYSAGGAGTEPVLPFLVDVWDALWGAGLLAINEMVRFFRIYSTQFSLSLLTLLVAGTAAFTDVFSKLRVGPVYITELCIVLLLLVLGMSLTRNQIVLLPRGRLARRVVYFVGAYLVFGTVRLIVDFGSGASASLLEVLRNFAVVYYALFAIIGWLVLQPLPAHSVLRSIGAIVVTVSTLTSLWTVLLYTLNIHSLADEGLVDVSVVVQGQAVVFAMFSLLIIANLLRYNAMPENILFRGLIIAVFLLNVLYVYLSGHRSAVMGCAAGGAMLIVSSKTKLRSRIRWRWVVLALLAAGCILYLLSGYLVDFTLKFKTLLSPLEEINAAWRAVFWIAVVFLWLSAPVCGVGFAHDFYEEEPLHAVQAQHYDPHNSYLAILARTGIVGLFFMSAASFASVRLLIRLVRSSPRRETTLIASCLLSCFAAIATFASANVTLESPYHAMFFWLLIGMGIALAETEEGVDGLVSRS